jgi:hypothetical protein
MARIFRRSILWLVPVVVIPLGALLLVQYRFLRTLQSKTVSAERSWLRDSTEHVADDIDQHYRTAALRALTIERDCLCQSATLGQHFRETPIDGARTFFAVRFEGSMRTIRTSHLKAGQRLWPPTKSRRSSSPP